MGELDVLIQAIKEVCSHGLPGFDLHRNSAGPEIKEKVHFETPVIAPKIERRSFPVVEKDLLNLVDSEILKNSASQRVVT
jgi:hypothetical protein